MHFLNKKKADILILVDTRLSKEVENQVRAEWGGFAFFSSFSSQSRGVAVLIRKDFPGKVLDTFADLAGNISAILLGIEEKSILIEGIYGPNADTPIFFSDEVFKRMKDWDPNFAIYVGDWNIVLNPDLDTFGYQHVNNPRARQELQTKINELELIDIFRNLNPTQKKYSWKQWGGTKRARLDYFLISNTLLPYVQKTEILPTCYSDHNPIIIEIDFSKFQRGKGFWKLNNSLLYDPEYVKVIKEAFKRVTCQYAIVDNNEDFIDKCSDEELQEFLSSQTPESLQTFPLKINSELFLETLLMEVRRVSILFSAAKKRNLISEELRLLNDLEILENNANLNEEETDQVKEKKAALEEIYNYQAQGAYIRSRALYKVDGERPTRMFCALEKCNGVQKYVPQLIVLDGAGQEKTIDNQKEVEKEITSFYESLYEDKDEDIEIHSIEDFLEQDNFEFNNKLSESQKQKLEGKISLDEMTSYLKRTKNNVSPGSSGFTNEFYKFFWRDLKVFVINATDFAFENERLSVTQNLGIISIIPKGDKDKRYLTNWRPLTLLNTLYKLVSGCIADRIKPVLNQLIHPDQKGFVAGRYIGEVVRSTYDIMHYAKENNLPGLLLCIDFEKAYDSISFKYIKKCLQYFNFGDDLIKWVEILLHDFKAVINHCGNISRRFNISRGCRQGDPIASYLFILCIEILALKLRADTRIQGFQIETFRHLLEIYADDLTVFLEPNSINLHCTVEVLSNFYKLSGLRISLKKTKAVWFGSSHDSNIELCPDLNLQWSKSFTLLGIDFDNKLERMQDNFNRKIIKIEKLLNCWSYRYLTPFGKITIVKSLGLSKISHIALVIPNPSKNMIKKINSLFYNFVWGGGSEKVNREDAMLPEKWGGLGTPDIQKFWTAFKFSWLRRLLTTNSFWPTIIQMQVNKILGYEISVTDILKLGSSKLNQISKQLKNDFWKQVFGSIISITEGAAFCYPEKFLSTPFFHNNLVMRNNKVVKEVDFPELSGKIETISDFYIPGTTTLFQWVDFCDHYECNISEEKFIDIRYIITLAVQKLKISSNRLIPASRPIKPILIDIALMCTKGCRPYYLLLRKKNIILNKIYKRESKWHQELGYNLSIEFWNLSRKLCAKIRNDNKLKWLQYQILRNSLQTNYIVSHFNRNVTKQCYYCRETDELISHLFWSCMVVQGFRNELIVFFHEINFDYSPSKNQFLFGFHNLSSAHPKNYISFIMKRFIWINKFKNGQLTTDGFKNLFKTYLVDLKYIFDIKKETALITEWNTIFNAFQI